MKTLQQCYEDIATDQTKWSYYENSIDISNKWTDNKAAFEFIKKYFEYAGKSRVFIDENIDKNRIQIEDRAGHTISTFLLGLKIADSFGLEIFIREDNNMNFKYYWFLACLYHDVGYVFENKKDFEKLNIVQKDGIEGLQEVCGIKYIHERVFITYSKERIELYLKKRSETENEQGKLDHGIVGGLLLYDKLRRQFETAWKKRTNHNDTRESFYFKDECNDRDLHLSNKHYDAYAKAANAIIAHNIWKSTLLRYMETYQESRKNTAKKIKRINIDDNLCFILSLADTLEPLKRKFSDLDFISIGTIDYNQGIELQINIDAYNELYQNVKSLEDWMEVEVIIKEIEADMVSIKIGLPIS